MEYNKDFFLNALRDGVDIDVYGKEIADAMNEAQKAYQEELAKSQNDLVKRDLITEMLSIIQKLGAMEGIDPDMLTFNEDDIEKVTKYIDNMLSIVKTAATLDKKLKANPVAFSDDQIIADFLNAFI